MPQPSPESQGTTPPEAAGRAANRVAKPGRVAIIMGSQSDWPVMRHAAEMLEALDVPHDARIVSAHRTPERLYAFARGAREAGYSIIIAGAGGAAHLPGMTAAMTPLPVFGVPVPGSALGGRDALYSIVQMPGGVPVGTLAIGKPGAINAALLAAAVLALNDDALAERLALWRAASSAAVGEVPVDAPGENGASHDGASAPARRDGGNGSAYPAEDSVGTAGLVGPGVTG